MFRLRLRVFILIGIGLTNVAHAASSRLLWTKRLPGLITDLDFSADGSKLLASTIPDPDRKSLGSERNLILFDRKGGRRWKLSLPSPTREQALAPDGTWAAVANYQSRVTAFGPHGKKKHGISEQWSREGMCRPIIWASPQWVSCYHDDDGGADGPILELWDWSGNPVRSFFATGDRGGKSKTPLLLRIASDASRAALVVAGGLVEIRKLADPDKGASFKVSGEVVDLEWMESDGDSARLAVLVTELVHHSKSLAKSSAKTPDPTPDRWIELWNMSESSAHRVTRLVAPASTSVVERLGSKDQLGFYGADASGEVFGVWELKAGAWSELWKTTLEHAVDVPAKLFGRSRGLWMVLSQTRLVRYGASGPKVESEIKFNPAKDTFITTVAVDEAGKTLAAAFEDGRLRVYDVAGK